MLGTLKPLIFAKTKNIAFREGSFCDRAVFNFFAKMYFREFENFHEF